MNSTGRALRVGVVGATGQVGTVMRRLLAERNFPVAEMRYFASARSAGTTLPWNGADIVVEDAALADPSGLDIALFSAGATSSRELAPKFAAAGVIVIDNSSAFRMDPDVPLVVSEVNGALAHNPPKGIIANPNCTTMAAMPVLKPLHDEAGLVRLIASTYQAVSGGGLAGVDELDKQAREVVDRAAELTHDGAAVTFPAPDEVRPTDRFQRVALRRLARRRRIVRDRRGAEAPQREPQDPRHPRARGVRHVRPRPGVHRPFVVAERRVRTAAERRPRPRSCSSTLPAWSSPTSRHRSKRPARTRATSAASARTRASPDGRGLALFVSNDNLRKGAALNAIQIAELVQLRR